MRVFLTAVVLVLVGVVAWRLLGVRGAEHESNLSALGRGTAAEAAAARPEGGSSSAPVGSRPVSAAPFVDASPPPSSDAATETPSTILCLVKNHEGRPAVGAIVAAFSAANSGGAAPSARFAADEEGRVNVADLPALLRDGDLRVVATVPGLGDAESPSILVTAATSTGTPRTMNLPPTVALRVTLRRTDETPYETESDVRLAPDGGPQSDFAEGAFGAGFDGAPGPPRAGVRRTSNGVADFPYVACGAELRISAASSAPRERRATKAWRAPKEPGPRAEISLTLGLPALTVAGRVVDGAGRPRAGARLLVQLRESAENAAASMFGGAVPITLADGDGQFEATIDRDPATVTAQATHIMLERAFGEGRSIETEASHGPPDASGRIELGDVALAAAPTLFKGRVIDASGAPVSFANIRFFRKDDTSGRFAQERFQLADFLKAGEDGTFAVLGVLEAGARLPAFVGAVRIGYVLVAPASLPATGPVTVRLALGGRVVGTFKKGPTADCAERFAIVVESSDFVAEDERLRECSLEDGGFSAEGVPAGTARAVVRFRGQDAPLVVVEGIAVEAGAEVADPRLQDLDFSARIGALRVTITDEAGAPVPDSAVSELAEGSLQWVERRADDKGVVAVPKAGAATRLIVRAPGYAAADLGRPTADRVVALKRPIRCSVVLTLPPDIALPAAPFGLSVSLRWGGPDESSVDDGHMEVAALAPEPDSGAFGTNREVELAVRAPGVYLLQTYVTHNNGGSSSAMWLKGAMRVTVAPTDKDLRVELKLTAEEIAARIEDARH